MANYGIKMNLATGLPTNWNRFQYYGSGNTVSNMTDTDGTTHTGVNITSNYTVDAYNTGTVTGDNLPFPEAVRQDGFYNYNAGAASYWGYTIVGLDEAKTYTVYVSGAYGIAASSSVTVNGGSAQTLTAGSTSTDMRSFAGVTPTTGGTIVIVGQSASGVFGRINGIYIEEETATTLSLDSVTGTVVYGGTFTANLTNGGSAGTATLIQGSYDDALTVNSWGASSASLSMPAIGSSTLVPGSATLSMTNAAAENDTLAVTIAVPTGKDVVTLTSVAASGLVPTDTALGVGDVIMYDEVVSQSGTPTAYALTVQADGQYSIAGTAPNGTYTFVRRVWDATDGTWGTEGTVTVTLGPGSAATVNGIIMQLIRTPFGLMIKPM